MDEYLRERRNNDMSEYLIVQHTDSGFAKTRNAAGTLSASREETVLLLTT